MSDTKQKTNFKNNYNTVIVGGGLSGLSVAANLKQLGRDVLVIEQNSELGSKSENSNHDFSHCFNEVPNSDLSKQALTFLAHTINDDLGFIENSKTPQTYDAGLKPFTGFGDSSPAFIDELDFYLSKSSLTPSCFCKAWLDRLSENIQADVMHSSSVTKIEVKDKIATELTINGSKKVSAERIIFSAEPKQLLNLLSIEVLKPKTRKSLSRSQAWTSVSLDMVHSSVISQSHEIFLLVGVKDKRQPCLGQFGPAYEAENGELHQNSQWFTLIDSDLTANSEITGSAYKAIKREFNRAFKSQPKTLFEKLHIHSLSHGTADLALNGNQTLPEVSNLYINSTKVHRSRNAIGSLLQSQLILSSLGESQPNDFTKHPVDAKHYNCDLP